jgi:hypothetical protein
VITHVKLHILLGIISSEVWHVQFRSFHLVSVFLLYDAFRKSKYCDVYNRC